MKFTKSLTGIFLLIVLFSAASFAQDSGKMKNDMSKKEMMDKEKMHSDMMQNDMKSNICTNMNGLAINGFDAVSYFTDGKPALGKSSYTYSWMNAKWQFASEEHMKMFKDNPENTHHSSVDFALMQSAKIQLLPATRLSGRSKMKSFT
jgi:pentapeptide MXKDX repeat protein